MDQLSLKDIPKKDLENKKVIVRVDFNVPLEIKDGKSLITNDLRIKASLPTIKYLIEAKAKIALVSHLGRPKGFDSALKMDPIAERLSKLLGKNVLKLNDSIGPEVESAIEKLNPGNVCLLENIRFYKEEEKNDPDFARKLAKSFNTSLASPFVSSPG